jgi:hypothetical protein
MSDFLKCECPNCGLRIEFAEADAGREAECPQCRHALKLPVPTAKLIQNEPAPIAPAPQQQVVPAQASPAVAPESTQLLPEIRDQSLSSIQVRSSDGESYYTVNLMDYTCSCPSFAEVHSKASPKDFGRLCKHICWCLNRPEVLPLLSPICLAMVREGFGINPGRLDRDNNGNPIYITGVNNKGWLNVFALKRRDGKTYYRFGYNVNEGRRAFGSKPRINEDILSPKRRGESLPSAASGLGWLICRGVLRGLGKMLALLAQMIVFTFTLLARVSVWIFIGVLTGLLPLVFKSGRRRRF